MSKEQKQVFRVTKGHKYSGLVLNFLRSTTYLGQPQVWGQHDKTEVKYLIPTEFTEQI